MKTNDINADVKPWEYIEELEIKIKELENFLEIKTSENTWLKEKIRRLEQAPQITVTAGNPKFYDKMKLYCTVCSYPEPGGHFEKCTSLIAPYGEWT